MTTRRAVLDADIIFSRVLHELIGRLAVGPRLFDLVWSDELLGEAKSALVDQKGLSDEAAEAWVGHMRREFPNGRVNPASVADDLDVESLTRDLGDVHVCALAIAGNAELLFTFDRGYLKEPLRGHGVEVPDLDQFLVDQCRGAAGGVRPDCRAPGRSMERRSPCGGIARRVQSSERSEVRGSSCSPG